MLRPASPQPYATAQQPAERRKGQKGGKGGKAEMWKRLKGKKAEGLSG